MTSNTSSSSSGEDLLNAIITPQDVEQIARNYTQDPSIRVLSYKFSPYSATKLGFTADHSQLTLLTTTAAAGRKNRSAEDEESTAISFFVKSVPYRNRKQAEFLRSDEGLFAKESLLLGRLIPRLLLEGYAGESWSPACYLIKRDRAIVMEDLRARRYRVIANFYDDRATLESALAALARFHACSILAESRLRAERKQHTPLDEVYPDACNEVLFSRTGKLRQFIEAGTKVVAAVAARSGCSANNLTRGLDQLYEMAKPSLRHNCVLCHGDLRANNLMFDDSAPLRSRCVLVDYRNARYAPLVLDVLHLLHLNSSRAFRDEYEGELVEFYASVLEESVRRGKDSTMTKVPTIDEISREMSGLRLFGAGMACLFGPTAYLDAEVTAECIRDSEGYERFAFGDRTDVVLARMERDGFYKAMIEESVREFVEVSENPYYSYYY